MNEIFTFIFGLTVNGELEVKNRNKHNLQHSDSTEHFFTLNLIKNWTLVYKIAHDKFIS